LTTLAVTCVAVAGSLAPAPTATGVSSGAATIRVTGTFLVAAAEREGEEYAIVVGDDVVPVAWSDPYAVPSGAQVEAELVLPSGLVDRYKVTGRSTLRAGTAVGDRALQLIDARSATLDVRELAVLDTDVQDGVPTPVAHRVYVVAPTNLGTFASTDDQLLAQVEAAASYWEDESDGSISDMVVPDAISRYHAVVATDLNNCGLDGEFFPVLEEAAEHFPAADFYSGTDLLVLLAPSLCTSTSYLGRALLGDGLSSGGVQVTVAEPDFVVGTLAHEWGHNFGLHHANLGPCDAYDCIGEYDNLYNVMGRSTAPDHNRLTALSTAYRSIAGVVAPGEVAELPFPETGGAVTRSFTLSPRSEESGQRAVRVVEPDTGEDVYVEYRSGGGQDALSAYARGVTHRGLAFRPGVVLESIDGRSAWLRSSGDRASLVSGDSWSNSSGTLMISAGAVTDTTASVTVVATPGAEWSSPPPTVTIQGSPLVGGQLYVGGGWDPSTVSRRIQWYVDDVAVAGTDDSMYLVRPEDVGAAVRASVTDYGYGLRPRTYQSAPVEIQLRTLVAYERPRIQGTPVVGQTLSSRGSIWSSLDGPTSTSVQWWSGSAAVPGATGLSYVVRAEDVGKSITMAETGTRAGYRPLTLVSDPTPVVTAPTAPAWPSTPTPRVVGSAQVGRVLTAETGTWPSGTGLTLQWLVDDLAVGGASYGGYEPVAADVGKRVAVRVTGRHPAYGTATRTSSLTSAVLEGVLGARRPLVRGRPRVGETLKAVAGAWTPSDVTLRYRWRADGRTIRGATGRRLLVRTAHRGTRISVTVTGRLVGYDARSARSRPTARVRR
jgi:hypothetical protein